MYSVVQYSVQCELVPGARLISILIRGPVDVSVRTKEYEDGWYVGQISNRGARRGEGTFYFLNGDRYIST